MTMRLIIGNLAIDTIFFNNSQESPGGPPYFISKALYAQQVKDVTILSCVGNDFDVSFFPELKVVNLSLVQRNKTTRVGIKKDTSNNEYGFLIDYSGRIESKDLNDSLKKSEVVYVSTILDDILPDVLKSFTNSVVALDIQGFIRKPSDKKWSRESWARAKEYLRYASILKMSNYERDFLPMSFEEVTSLGKLEVILLTLGKKGVIAYSAGKYYFMPALAKEVNNPVGAGDYILTCFTENYIKSKNVGEALINSSLEVAGFLEGKSLEISRHEANKMLRITKSLYIPSD